MLLNDNPKNLLEKLEIARRQLENAKSREEMLALDNYIYWLQVSIHCILPEWSIDKDVYKDTKDNRMLDRKYDAYKEKMLKNYFEHKEFHERFFEVIRKKTAHELRKLPLDDYVSITDLSEEDFYNILFEFMNKIGLSKTFDKFVKNKRIYTTKIEFKRPDEKTGVNEASVLYNPISKDSDIVGDRMEYDIVSMYILAHEFGHIYDVNHIKNAEAYNRQIQESFNDEIISKTFERLFVDFLLENNILYDEAMDQLFDTYSGNYEFILTAYIISLLPDIYLREADPYIKVKPTKIYKLVERYFSRKDPIKRFTNGMKKIAIQDTYNYAYGDVISMILRERVKEDNYNLDAIDEFIALKEDLFNPDMLEKLKVNPKTYVKLYKKDIELLKKQSN